MLHFGKVSFSALSKYSPDPGCGQPEDFERLPESITIVGYLENNSDRPVNALPLALNEVHIWQIDLARGHDEVQWYRRVLAADEAERADRFYFERDKNRFTVARAAMRDILSRYTGLAAQNVHFSYGAKGKPELSGSMEQNEIRFNLSHSSELALLAVTRGLTVGVDIEWVKSDFATDDIAERFFSVTEVQTLRSLPADQQAEAFFSCWTRKEAYIKALGEGLSVPLDSFSVAFTPGMAAALLHVKVDPHEVERWSMYNIVVRDGYKAAVVVQGKDHRLKQMEWVHGFPVEWASQFGKP
jgi:4'-phosphopantetheinyl transferase